MAISDDAVLAAAGVPDRYRRALDLPLDPRALPFIGGEVAELTYQGPLGTGKTWAATRALWEWLKRHPAEWRGNKIPGHFQPCYCRACSPRLVVDARWWDASEMVSAIAGEWGSDDRPVRDECKEVGLLLVDDLGAESGADQIKAELSVILRSRYNRMRPTIVTCNDLDSIEGRLASRLAGGVVVKLRGEDRRVTA